MDPLKKLFWSAVAVTCIVAYMAYNLNIAIVTNNMHIILPAVIVTILVAVHIIGLTAAVCLIAIAGYTLIAVVSMSLVAAVIAAASLAAASAAYLGENKHLPRWRVRTLFFGATGALTGTIALIHHSPPIWPMVTLVAAATGIAIMALAAFVGVSVPDSPKQERPAPA